MPLPLVGAQLKLAGQSQYAAVASGAVKQTGLISKALLGMGEAGVHGGNMLTGALTAVMGPVGMLAKGAMDLGRNFVSLAASGGSLRGIKVVFDNLTDSYGINADLLERLRASTKGAVGDFELMKQVNKALVGAGEDFGKMFGERLPLLMQVSREAAKAQGQSVEYMFDSIVTGIKRSSPMILDNLGFQFSLTEANEKYAASIGKTVDELSKEEKQIALLNAVTESSKQLIEATGGSVDTAAKQALAWRTALKNLRDNMAVELEPILMSVMGLIGGPSGAEGFSKAVIMATRSIVSKIVPAIDAFGVKLRSIVGTVIKFIKLLAGFKGLGFGEALKDLFSGGGLNSAMRFTENLRKILAEAFGPELASTVRRGLMGAFRGLHSQRGKVVAALEPITDVLGDVMAQVMAGTPGDFPWEDILPPNAAKIAYKLSDAFESLIKVDLGDAFDDIVKFGQRVWPTFKKMMTFGSPLSLMFEAIKKVGVDGFMKLWENAQPVLENMLLLITNLVTTAVSMFEEHWPTIEEIVNTVFGAITDIIALVITDVLPLLLDAFNVVMTWINDNWPSISETVSTVFGTILDVIQTVIDLVVPFIMESFQTVVGWVQENWPLISSVITKVLDTIWEVISTVLNTITSVWNEHVEGLKTLITGVWETISGIISTAIEAVLGIIKAALQILDGDWEGAWETIKETVSNIWEGIKTVIGDAIEAVKLALSLAMIAIKEVWKRVWTTIKTVAETIWGEIKEAISGALEPIKNLIEDVIELLKSGIEGAFNAVKSAWESTGAKAFGAIGDMIKGLLGIIETVVGALQRLVQFAKDAAEFVGEALSGEDVDIALGGGIDPNADILGGLDWQRGGFFPRGGRMLSRFDPGEIVLPLKSGYAISTLATALRKALVGDAGKALIGDVWKGAKEAMSAMQSEFQMSLSPLATAGATGVSNVTNNVYEGNEYNLTAQSVMRPGGLEMEFEAMEMSHL